MIQTLPQSIANTILETAPILYYAQGAAALAEAPIDIVGPGPEQIPVGSIIIHPGGNLAISGANYVTVNVYKRTAGGSQTLIGTTTTFTGGTAWSQFVPVALTLQPGAGSYLSPNDTITMSVVNTGAPTNVPFIVAGFVKAT